MLKNDHFLNEKMQSLQCIAPRYKLFITCKFKSMGWLKHYGWHGLQISLSWMEACQNRLSLVYFMTLIIALRGTVRLADLRNRILVRRASIQD